MLKVPRGVCGNGPPLSPAGHQEINKKQQGTRTWDAGNRPGPSQVATGEGAETRGHRLSICTAALPSLLPQGGPGSDGPSGAGSLAPIVAGTSLAAPRSPGRRAAVHHVTKGSRLQRPGAIQAETGIHRTGCKRCYYLYYPTQGLQTQRSSPGRKPLGASQVPVPAPTRDERRHRRTHEPPPCHQRALSSHKSPRRPLMAAPTPSS